MTQLYYPQLDETLYREVLPNGLTVAVVPRKDFTKKMAYFVTDFGSMHRDFVFEGQTHHVPMGVAHYLEHKMFDLPGGRDVSQEFADMGASANAFTSYDLTAYYFACTENFDKCLHLLLEFVSTPYFTQETVDKERGIIDQEIGMNQDSPDSEVFESLMRSLYREHPIREPILGTSETIRRITPEILHLCHRAFYTPGNMMLCVVGDVEPQMVADMAMEVLGTELREVGEKVSRWHEPMEAAAAEVSRKMSVSMPTFSMAFKCEAPGHGEQNIHREMVADQACEALFGESSELYLKLYEEGLIDSSFGGGFETIDGCAMVLCSGDSEDPRAVRQRILEEAEQLVRRGIPQEDFLRMKRSALGRRIRGLDSFDSTCFRICAYYLSGFDYFRFPRVYVKIQAQEIVDFIAKAIDPRRCSLSIIYPNDKEATA